MKLTKPLLLTGMIVAGFGWTAVQAMGRIPKKEYDEKVAALNDCAVRLSNCNADSANLRQQMEAQAADAKTKIETLASQNDQLLKDMESGKNELQKRVAEMTKEKQDIEKEKQAEVDKLKSTYADLMTDMKKEIEQGSIQITQLQGKLSVNLVDKILFDSGESEVNADGKKVLLKVANVLKKVQNKQIRIEGHTDNVPIGGVLKEKFPTNWELSTARATTVARFLTEVCGVNPQFLSAAGYSHFRPIADNGNPEGRSKNRRIEIALIPLEMAAATPPQPAPNAPAETPKKP